MQINLIYDSSTANAPIGFVAAMNYAAQYLDNLITNNITVNIQVGWGEVGGTPLGGAAGEGGPNGDMFSYAQLKADLLAHSSSAVDAAAYANLPPTDISNGAGFFVSTAEEKAWGILPANGTEIDGAVGFSNTAPWNFSTTNQAIAGQYDFLGDALHELTHALGRDSGLNPGSPMTVMDLFQYASPGVIQTNTGSSSYFSIDGGATNLGTFSNTSDLGDWSNTVPNDSFDAFTVPGQAYTVSPNDVALLNVLGFNINSAMSGGAGGLVNTTSSVRVTTDDSSSEVGIGHVVTIALNTNEVEFVSGVPTLSLNDNQIASYVGGSGSNQLEFAYTVQVGDNISDLQMTALNLPNGATITDILSNPLSSVFVADLGVQVVTQVTNLTSNEDHLVYMLYQAAFNRMPDYSGFEYWAGQADAHQLTALQLADQFLAAPEFAANYGANPSNDAFVTALYGNVLGRAPDAAGLAYWEAQANAGMARDQLLVDFATSTENVQLTAQHTANGFWVT